MKNETIKPSAVNPQSILQSLKDDFDSYSITDHSKSDFQYLVNRYNNEGLPFLCITLPSLGKAFERTLTSGKQFVLPEGWVRKRGSVLPRIFYDLFKKVMNDDGFLIYHEHNHVAVKLIRQVTLFWSRYETNTYEGYEKTIDEFHSRIARHRNVLPNSLQLKDVSISQILSRARALIHTVFDSDSPRTLKLRRFNKNPWGRHGPGAVAGKESATEKWNFIRYGHTPDILFRYNDHDERTIKSTNDVPVARVCCVPKDFRGPRVICIEPKENQFAQQGLMELLMTLLERHPLSKRHINFKNVEVSRKLCYDLRFATIDLKNASDQISLNLVKWLFPPWLYRLLVRYRTPIIDNIRSGCFATMGSALCFPVQTTVFWALAQATVDLMSQRYNAHIRYTRVFGDDIIVPTRYAFVVNNVLTACGLEVNKDKTCVMTPARESCGEWTYGGFPVRVVRPKNHILSSFSDWSGIIDVANEIQEDFPALSSYLRKQALNFYSPRERWNKNLQRHELRLPFLSGRRQKLDGFSGLYAWTIGSNLSPFSKGALFRVKWRWASASTKIWH